MRLNHGRLPGVLGREPGRAVPPEHRKMVAYVRRGIRRAFLYVSGTNADLRSFAVAPMIAERGSSKQR